MPKIFQFPVQVKSTTEEDGTIRPLAVYWEDEPYPVDIIRRRDLDLVRKSIGNGDYFLVQACGKVVGLIHNDTTDNWIMEIQAG